MSSSDRSYSKAVIWPRGSVVPWTSAVNIARPREERPPGGFGGGRGGFGGGRGGRGGGGGYRGGRGGGYRGGGGGYRDGGGERGGGGGYGRE
jgi:hypothetical protein